MTAQPKSAELQASTPIVGQKVINLALQGGGSHGAFTWGVLDRLLEDERIAFDGITATSAGGVNAVVFADGKREASQFLEKDVRHGSLQHHRSFFFRPNEP
jgi:NTE family protein